jgi:hypothetical protein
LICQGISSVGGSSILEITSGFGFLENSQNQRTSSVIGVLKIHRIKEPLLVLGF